ncbi:MAG: hypothetical protein ACKOC5_11760 [Chloroflexota bacterium]
MNFAELYERFSLPVSAVNCGERCAPHNDRGVPFCCDTAHAVPSVYAEEWAYLQANTDLWRPWKGRTRAETDDLRRQAPDGQVLVACLGHQHCRRSFRSLTCRAFPFFPYISRAGEFLGLSYYWEYEDRCWVISNLALVEPGFRSQFIAAFEALFAEQPQELENFRQFSSLMRRVFGRRKRAIPLLHRNGGAYKVTPRNGRLRRLPVERLPKFGPYKLAAELPFPDEL